MLKSCIPVLGYESWIFSPKLFVSEVLHNYTRGSSNQSGIWDIRTYLGDMASVANDRGQMLARIKESLEYYLKRELDTVEVIVENRKIKYYVGRDIKEVEGPFVTIKWTHDGSHDSLSDIDLNNIANINAVNNQ